MWLFNRDHYRDIKTHSEAWFTPGHVTRCVLRAIWLALRPLRNHAVCVKIASTARGSTTDIAVWFSGDDLQKLALLLHWGQRVPRHAGHVKRQSCRFEQRWRQRRAWARLIGVVQQPSTRIAKTRTSRRTPCEPGLNSPRVGGGPAVAGRYWLPCNVSPTPRLTQNWEMTRLMYCQQRAVTLRQNRKRSRWRTEYRPLTTGTHTRTP